MAALLVRCWKDPQKTYGLSKEDGLRKHRVSMKGAADGFVKHFMWGKLIVVYKSEGSWKVWTSGVSTLADHIENVEVTRRGPFIRLRFTIDNKSFDFVEMDFLEYFAYKLDPTYDYLDRMETFGYWLLEEWQKGLQQ